MNPLLQVDNLVKQYNGNAAVDGISFSIDRGLCFGLLGPNGAGKTTTIEVIEGILEPTSGTILYKGNPRDDGFQEQIGIQFQQTALLSFLSVRETLETFAAFYRQTTDIEALIDMCRLEGFIDQYNHQISGGQRQRFLVALALINQPELLFLDEPSTGLDPQARRVLWELVQSIKDAGRTIVLTTHYMEEAEFLCEQIAIMDHGQIIARGSPEELIKEHCQGLTVVLPSDHLSAPRNSLTFDWQEHNGRIEIQTEDINACIAKLIALDADLSQMSIRTPNLENVFLNLTGRQLRE
jgi:ABC-2 type transport system ATP-binding protein